MEDSGSFEARRDGGFGSDGHGGLCASLFKTIAIAQLLVAYEDLFINADLSDRKLTCAMYNKTSSMLYLHCIRDTVL
jgi:hypothetical protein